MGQAQRQLPSPLLRLMGHNPGMWLQGGLRDAVPGKRRQRSSLALRGHPDAPSHTDGLGHNQEPGLKPGASDVENGHMDTKGGKLQWGGDGGVLNWAIGIDMYTLMCIKLMTNKNQQYKKTNKQNN